MVAQFNRQGQQKPEKVEEPSLDITGRASFWWYLTYVASVGESNDILPLQQTKSVQTTQTLYNRRPLHVREKNICWYQIDMCGGQ